MNKNLITAVVLSSLVYILWFTYVAPPPKKQPEQQTVQTSQTKTGDSKEEKVSAKTNPVKAETAVLSGKPASAPKPYIIETPTSKVLLDSGNGAILDLEYKDKDNLVKLLPEEQPGGLCALEGLPYKISEKTPSSLTLTASISKDISVTKKISFSNDENLNKLEFEFKNNSKTVYEIPSFDIKMGPGLGTVPSEEKDNPKTWKAAYVWQEQGKKHPTFVTIKEDVEGKDWLWTGIDNRYFLFALINDGNLGLIKHEKKKISEKDAPFIYVYTKPLRINPGEKKTLNLDFYLGPKNYKLLGTLGKGLDRSVDFGFFAPLAKIANSALQFFYSKTGNYGTAIIIISVLLQILIFPLGMKSYKAMAIMKKIQPEMQALQAKYKQDPKRMNVEVMELYKKHGANPLSGCWPMLLQLPVFFALFTTLRNSWNLHGAFFAFWIKDLSAKDPYYVLPIAMGALMFIQQYISPQTTTDPTQAKIMKWMPVVFTFMFLSFPSGLVIYWIINSLFSIAQNLYLKNNMA